MSTEWFVERKTGISGPYTSGKLKALVANGKLAPNDLIRKGADSKAVPASRVKGLFDQPASPSPMLPLPTQTNETKAPSPPPVPGHPPVFAKSLIAKSRKVALWAIVVIGGLFGLAVVASIIGVVADHLQRPAAVTRVAPAVAAIAAAPIPPEVAGNSALSKMDHKITAMPAPRYAQIQAAIDKHDADQLEKLLKGIDGCSLFTQEEVAAMAHPVDGEHDMHKSIGHTTYWQRVDLRCGGFHLPEQPDYKQVSFTVHTGSGSHIGWLDYVSPNEPQWIDGISKLTFKSKGVQTCIEFGKNGKPSGVICQTEGYDAKGEFSFKQDPSRTSGTTGSPEWKVDPHPWSGTIGEKKLYTITLDGATRLKGHTAAVNAVAFSLDNKRLLSGSYDGTVKVWDVTTGRNVLTLEADNKWVNAVAFSQDGRRLAVAVAKSVRVWDALNGEKTQMLTGHTDSVNSVAFSPDGTHVASGSDDNTIKIWDVASGQVDVTLKGHAEKVRSVAFSPDGRRLVSGSHDQTIKVWDMETKREAFTLNGHTAWVTSVAISPDGTLIASGSTDQTVRLWAIGGGKETNKFDEGFRVSSLGFSGDGKRLASGGIGGSKNLALRDVASGREIAMPQVIVMGSVAAVALSPDGVRLALTDNLEGFLLKVWELPR